MGEPFATGAGIMLAHQISARRVRVTAHSEHHFFSLKSIADDHFFSPCEFLCNQGTRAFRELPDY
jgi:hypothetical protein